MRVAEILIELGDAPASFEVLGKSDELYHARSDELDLDFFMTRTISGVTFEFLVKGEYSSDGENADDAIRIFSTAKNILIQALDDFLLPDDKYVKFSSALNKPSRLKLYRRMVPTISEILGPEWKYVNTGPNSGRYVWQRIAKRLNEKPVESAWISDLTYNRPNKVLTMRLSNGISYSILGVSRTVFQQWLKSRSKGLFFHDRIKNSYKVERI